MRGCFTHVELNSGYSRGAQLVLPGGVDSGSDTYYTNALPASGDFSQPLLCVGFSADVNEQYTFNKCFGNRTYTYAFGHDPNRSVITVDMLGFLVDGFSYSGVMDIVLDAYREHRVSESKDYAMLALGASQPMRGFIVGVSTNTLDPKHSLQMFKFKLAMPGVM